eukprot:4631537-Amphidinium_carterae.1
MVWGLQLHMFEHLRRGRKFTRDDVNPALRAHTHCVDHGAATRTMSILLSERIRLFILLQKILCR